MYIILKYNFPPNSLNNILNNQNQFYFLYLYQNINAACISLVIQFSCSHTSEVALQELIVSHVHVHNYILILVMILLVLFRFSFSV